MIDRDNLHSTEGLMPALAIGPEVGAFQAETTSVLGKMHNITHFALSLVLGLSYEPELQFS